MIEKFGIIKFSYCLNEMAEIIGVARRRANDKFYEEVPSKKAGEWDELVHPLGVKGELIFAMYLYKNNIDFKLNTLLSDSPVVEWDIMVNDKRIDVKTIRPDGWDLLVKVKSHKFIDKPIDSYVFIQIIDDTTARYWIFKHEEVSEWDVKNTKYNDNYYKPIKDLLQD
jgi:hypothetical protein